MLKSIGALGMLLVSCAPQASPIARPTGPMSAETPPVDPTTLQPTPLPQTPPPVEHAQLVPPAPLPLPPVRACVPADAKTTSAQLTEGGVSLCLDDIGKSCWAVDFATATWTAEPPGAHPPVPAWATVARGTVEIDASSSHVTVCSPPAPCQTIAFTLLGSDPAIGATAIGTDRVAVWSARGTAILDLKTAKRLVTIRSWKNPQYEIPNLQAVYGLGGALGDDDAVELLSAASPISASARLFSSKTGKQIAMVGGLPRDKYVIDIDGDAPFPVAPHEWAFLRFNKSQLFVHDTRTGKLVRTIDLLDAATQKAITDAQGFDMTGTLVARIHAAAPTAAYVPAMVGLAPVATIDLATGKRTPFPAPLCK